VVVAEYAGWTARLVISAVFAAAAFGKLAARAAAMQAVADFGVPGLLVLALLAVFSAVVARVVLRGEHPACACFGAAGVTRVGVRTLARNGVLAVLAAVALACALASPRLPPAGRAAGLAVTVVLGAVLAWQGMQLRALRAQVSGPAVSQAAAEGLPAGSVAPEFALPGADGAGRTLEGLLAGGLPMVLVFLHPGCGPCRLIAGELPRWRQRRAGQVEIVVVSSGTLEENRLWAAEYGITGVLVQDRFEVARRYRLRGTPDAVLIGQDGRVRIGAAGGPAGIRELLATAAPM